MSLPNVTINDDDLLYRRLHHTRVYEDGSVKSIAYMFNSRPDPEVSVDLARLTTPEEAAGRGKPGTGLGEIVTSVPRALGFQVEYRPLPENPAHSQIEGHNTKALCKQLAEATQMILMPQKISNAPTE
ncbi:MAG: hypothetical protein HOP19_00510 [Acidobacteria bacterium]|nr:hypothetical protein [Acidobacteriota bacterium]